MSAQPVNILLVEDDVVDVMNVRRAFQKAKINDPLELAGDGVEALEILRRSSAPSKRQLILLDLNLPRMNGIEFLRELRADPALHQLPVVVLTTSADEKDKVDAFEFNVAGYLVKPITIANFVELMSAVRGYWALGEMP